MAAVSVLVGCGPTYSKSVKDARSTFVEGRIENSIDMLNERLEVDESYQRPDELDGEKTLLLLERATLLQALGEHDVSARDMMIADQRLGWLDIAAQGKMQVGKYLYSGSSAQYLSPPYERLMLNTLNMINFLALRRWEGARVEARRFSLLEYFYLEKQDKTLLPGAVAFGNYLGAMAFEASGDYREAAKRYLKAWTRGIQHKRLRQRIVALCSTIGRDPSDFSESRFETDLKPLDRAAASRNRLSYTQYRKRYVDGDLLVLVQTGVVPYKETRRYSVAQAVQFLVDELVGSLSGLLKPAEASSQEQQDGGESAESDDEDDEFGEGQTDIGTDAAVVGASSALSLSSKRFNLLKEMAASGLVDSLNVPVMTSEGLPGERDVALSVDGESLEARDGVDVGKQVEHAWERIFPEVMLAAVTRLAVRVASATALRWGLKSATRGDGDSDDSGESRSSRCVKAEDARSKHCGKAHTFETEACMSAYTSVENHCGPIESCWQAKRRRAACCGGSRAYSDCCDEAKEDIESYCERVEECRKARKQKRRTCAVGNNLDETNTGCGRAKQKVQEVCGDMAPQEQTGESGRDTARTAGMVMIGGAQRAAAKASNPDTRSWSFLPGRIRFRRVNLEPGRHQIRLNTGNRTENRTVEIPDSGPTLVNFSKHR